MNKKLDIIREPHGVELTVINRDPSPEERKAMSAYIAQRKLEIQKLLKRREKAAAKRAASKAADGPTKQ